MPRVSVLVPVYNAEKYLAECLSSVRKQTWLDWELVCCNDGSKDASLSILQELAAQEPRLRVLSWENRGSGAVRNRLLSQAQGEYIVFLDADDLLRPDALAQLVARAEQTGADMVRCLFSQIELDGSVRDCRELYPEYLRPAPTSAPKERFRAALDDSNVWGKIIRREFITRHGLKFVEGQLVEDVSFEVLLYWLADKIDFLDQELFLYRKTDTSFSSSADRMLLGTLKNFTYLLSALETYGLKGEDYYNLAAKQVIRRLSRLRKLSAQKQADGLQTARAALDALATYKHRCGAGLRCRIGLLLWLTRGGGLTRICRWSYLLRGTKDF